MTQAAPIPVRPVRQGRPGAAVERAAYAALVARHRGGSPAEAAQSLWPQDRLTHAVLGEQRAVQSLGTSDGWGSDLVGEAVADFFASLGPLSAMGQIIGRGLSVSLPGRGSISIPYRSAQPGESPWVAEGEPIRVLSYGFAAKSLGPSRKAATITVVSGELYRRTNAEPIFRRMLREDAGRTLDAAYLSAGAASSSALAGLLNGVTETAGTSSDVTDDLAALASAVSTSGEVVFIAAPKRAARIRVRKPELASAVFASAVIPADRVIALDPLALVHGFGGEPDITSSIEALVHMSDDADPIRASGATADPVRSLFQTDALAVRMILDLAFAKITDDAAAFKIGRAHV